MVITFFIQLMLQRGWSLQNVVLLVSQLHLFQCVSDPHPFASFARNDHNAATRLERSFLFCLAMHVKLQPSNRANSRTVRPIQISQRLNSLGNSAAINHLAPHRRRQILIFSFQQPNLLLILYLVGKMSSPFRGSNASHFMQKGIIIGIICKRLRCRSNHLGQ